MQALVNFRTSINTLSQSRKWNQKLGNKAITLICLLTTASISMNLLSRSSQSHTHCNNCTRNHISFHKKVQVWTKTDWHNWNHSRTFLQYKIQTPKLKWNFNLVLTSPVQKWWAQEHLKSVKQIAGCLRKISTKHKCLLVTLDGCLHMTTGPCIHKKQDISNNKRWYQRIHPACLPWEKDSQGDVASRLPICKVRSPWPSLE